MKERVNVSTRPLKDGVSSVFLDYRIGGKRKRENLKLYLYPEKTAADRAKNAETMRVARAKRDRREFELEQMEAGIEVKARPTLVTFDEYLARYNEVAGSESVKANVPYAIGNMGGTFLQDMNRAWFVRYVRKMEEDGAKANTIRQYVTLIKGVLKMAKDDGIIQATPRTTDILPKKEQALRVYLTIDELRAMAAAPCKRPDVKRAFLFCCFTGLRISDVKKLRNEDIVNGTIVIRQKKTHEPVRIPINASARALLEDGGLPFSLHNEVTIRNAIGKWARAAGVDKHVTFHSSRHTFATLALSNDANITVISSLLGHRSVKTTQIYAHIVDEARRKAVDLIPEL